MHSGMPLYRNHFRRSRDAPEANRDQLHSSTWGREVNRCYIDAVARRADSCRIVHPPASGIIQVFYAPVSLIRERGWMTE